MRAFHKMGMQVLFRGDSHLLDGIPNSARWQLKRALLKRVFSWPSGFLVVGAANRAYYKTFGVAPDRLISCPHSIDVTRFAQPADLYEESQAMATAAGHFRRQARAIVRRKVRAQKATRWN